jgi:hypothetical protein
MKKRLVTSSPEGRYQGITGRCKLHQKEEHLLSRYSVIEERKDNNTGIYWPTEASESNSNSWVHRL